MKPVSMWVVLGMSLFLTLNSEAQPPVTIDGIRQQLPPMGVMAQPKPQNGVPTKSYSLANTSVIAIDFEKPNATDPSQTGFQSSIRTQPEPIKDGNPDPMMRVNKFGLINDNDLIEFTIP